MLKQMSKRCELAGSLFVGALIGIAIGILTDDTAVGLMLAVGIGFTAVVLSRTFIK